MEFSGTLPSLAFQCLQFQGKELRYIDGSGKVQTRILDNVIFNTDTNEYDASFRYSEKWKRALLISKIVPLNRVLLPHITSPELWTEHSSSSSTSSTSPSEAATTRNTRNVIRYGSDHYRVTYNWKNFKAGDEVVWNRYSTKEAACFGRIVVTAEKEDVLGDVHLAAVVELERVPATGNDAYPPGYINYLNIKNTFLIPEKELLKLDEWIVVMSKDVEIERSNEETDWTLVSRSKKGNKGKHQPKYDEHRNINLDSPQSPVASSSNSAFGKSSDNNHEIRQRISPPDFDRSLKKTQQQNRSQRPKALTDNDQVEEEEKFPRFENDWKLPLAKPEFFKLLQQNNGYKMGVQGNNNSCYMDASLFALFSFTDGFDEFIVTESSSSEDGDGNSSQLKEVLKNDIIFQMRQHPYFVPKRNIKKMREIFGAVFNNEYLFRFMDVEDFLGDLFKLLNAPPFFHYDNGDGDHIHQIALPFTWEKREYKPYLSLQTLIENSFKTFQVKLEKEPDEIFIVKLPVSDGVLIPCDGVIPDLTLNLAEIMETTSEQENASTKMTLYSVICLRNNHFVTWVRTGKTLNSPWVYMDSRPTIQLPFVSYLPDVDQIIENARDDLSENEKTGGNIRLYEPQCENYSLFRHAYVCIYTKQ